MYKVIFYKDSKGNEPVREYMDKVRDKACTSKQDRIKYSKIVQNLKMLREYGTRAGQPFVKHIDEDIWELRPLSDRVLFFYWKDDTFVLLHYFHKKTQKTPKKEILRAKSRVKDFLEREDV